jgi:hypothetical protein
MKRTFLLSGVVLLVVVLLLYFWMGLSARKKSNEALAKFNAINNDLKSANDSMTPQERINAAQQNLPVGIMNSRIILLIDSLKGQYELADASHLPILPARLEQDIKRLLFYMQEVNKFKWNMVDSMVPDTINYWPTPGRFSEDKWLSTFFRKQPKELVITYLRYLKNEAIANN